MKKLPRVSPLMVSSLLLACDDPGREPLAPDSRDPLAASPAAAVGGAISSRGEKASGHADVFATSVQNVRHETYSFTAIPAGAAPLAKGQVEAHFLSFTGEEITVHAEVTCLSVVGNQAWVGGRVRRWVLDQTEVPEGAGRPMIFRVQDLGEGRVAIDRASLLFFGMPNVLAYCNTRPAFPILFESRDGGIQVNPE
jgi:hypothetical protein